MTINLKSDTVTKPSAEMLTAMINAEVGDDVLGTDPTVIMLENKLADMFGMEKALFCPSGTMTNQIAIKVHTNPLDEMICDVDSHVYRYENGGFAFNSGISIALLNGNYGKITADQIEERIQPTFDWLPKSSLVVLENTCNKGGGGYYTKEEIKPIYDLCQQKKLKLHLDGARIFNALAESNDSPKDMGQLFDSISVCLSKGLGAPIGSCLLGSADYIKEARRFRKVMGGGMRQAGYLAAACIYALDHNIERLKIDHKRAKKLAKIMASKSFVESINPVHTNILIFNLHPSITAQKCIETLQAKNILAVPFGKYAVRFVTHLDISDSMFFELETILKNLCEDDFK